MGGKQLRNSNSNNNSSPNDKKQSSMKKQPAGADGGGGGGKQSQEATLKVTSSSVDDKELPRPDGQQTAPDQVDPSIGGVVDGGRPVADGPLPSVVVASSVDGFDRLSLRREKAPAPAKMPAELVLRRPARQSQRPAPSAAAVGAAPAARRVKARNESFADTPRGGATRNASEPHGGRPTAQNAPSAAGLEPHTAQHGERRQRRPELAAASEPKAKAKAKAKPMAQSGGTGARHILPANSAPTESGAKSLKSSTSNKQQQQQPQPFSSNISPSRLEQTFKSLKSLLSSHHHLPARISSSKSHSSSKYTADSTQIKSQRQKSASPQITSPTRHLHQTHTPNYFINTKIMADQAVVDKLEAGYAKLQAATPDKCHSLLKKYLTREVLDKLKAKKTAMGATLLDVVQSGFENLDSGVGVYAPDAESYTLFSDLFDPIIQDYHGGFKPTDKHPASDFGDLDSLVNVDPNNEFVISTRVRCGRSLQGYPFNPCLTEAQYKEMESKVSSTFKEMTDDLAGTYYPLTGMTKDTQQQLIDDHFLFKEGDRFLQAANACRYWPTGRGIYHNSAKTFLVWVNEEDHLRIISMQKGGDLKTVFSRLVKGARAIEAKVPFSRDQRLGFLTFCPTNLGTTIRASVHIKLPKLAADRKKLEEVAGKYNLQVRGTSGEHTESVGGVYDISNKRRLGLTEYQAVREMQDGILELIKIEKSL